MHITLMNMVLLVMCIKGLVHAVEVLWIQLKCWDDTLQRVHKIHCKAFRLPVMLLRAWKLCLSRSQRVLDWVVPQTCHPVRSDAVDHQTLKLGVLDKLNREALRLQRGWSQGSWFLICLQVLELTDNCLECSQHYKGLYYGSHKDQIL